MGMKARANVATFFKYFVLILMGFNRCRGWQR